MPERGADVLVPPVVTQIARFDNNQIPEQYQLLYLQKSMVRLQLMAVLTQGGDRDADRLPGWSNADPFALKFLQRP